MKFKGNLQLNRYEWVKEVLENLCRANNNHENIYLFDIGSKDETLKKYCESPPIKYEGFDIEPLTDNVRYWDIENPFPYSDPKPDIITLLEVVEHLNNPWLSFKNLSEVLKIDGILFLSTPNPSWSNSRLHLFLNGELACFRQSDLDLNHHVFTPWPHIIEKLLSDNGFEIIKYVTLDGNTNLFDANLRVTNFPQQLVYRFSKKIIEFFDPSSKGMSYGLIAKKIK